MKVSLRSTTLHYGNGITLFTAASGKVNGLHALYLIIEDENQLQAAGEVRINISYLNHFSDDEVIQAAIQAIQETDWTVPADELLAQTHASAWIAPVKNLFDCTLHDYLAKRDQLPLAHWLKPAKTLTRIAINTNQTLFWSDKATLLNQIKHYLDRGFNDLKIRVAIASFEEDVDRLTSIRTHFGHDVLMAIDVNGNWTESEASDHITKLAPLQLSYIEQPIAAGNWKAIAKIAEQSPTPIMLDESLASLADIQQLCAIPTNMMAHLKLVKLGGISPCLQACHLLEQANIPYMIGQMNEGGLATAAALHTACATSPAYAELYGADGLSDDPAQSIPYLNGQIDIPEGPGLGLSFDPQHTQLIWSN